LEFFLCEEFLYDLILRIVLDLRSVALLIKFSCSKKKVMLLRSHLVGLKAYTFFLLGV
jgi:hypothetical protein